MKAPSTKGLTMKRTNTIRNLSLSLLLAAAVFAAPAYAQISVTINIAPPAPQYEVVPAVPPGYVWAPGYWAWTGERTSGLADAPSFTRGLSLGAGPLGAARPGLLSHRGPLGTRPGLQIRQGKKRKRSRRRKRSRKATSTTTEGLVASQSMPVPQSRRRAFSLARGYDLNAVHHRLTAFAREQKQQQCENALQVLGRQAVRDGGTQGRRQDACERDSEHGRQ